MALNPLLILAGDKPDLAGGVFRANEQAFTQGQRNRENALQRFQRDQGAALTRGDQGALDQFAQFDPAASFQFRGAVDERARAEQARQAAARASAQKAELLELQRILDAGDALIGQGPDAFNAGMAQLDPDGDLAGMGITAENFGDFSGAVRAKMGISLPPQEFVTVNDQRVPAGVGGDFSDPVGSGFRQLKPEEVVARGLDPEKAYQVAADGKVSQIGGSGVSVSVINEGPDAGKFNEASARVIVNEMSDVSTAGAVARRSLLQLNSLESALATTPGGAKTGFQAWLGSKGIATEGLDDVQLAEALISQLVPAQRPPGSGVMSDADLALFKLSLPRLMNTPGGNAKIIDTMRGIAQYDIEMGNIARKGLLGEITPRQAFDDYADVSNPLAEFSQGGGGAEAAVNQALGGQAPQVSQAPSSFTSSQSVIDLSQGSGKTPEEIWNALTPEQQKLWQN